jgi:AraC-like DNA-binding protein
MAGTSRSGSSPSGLTAADHGQQQTQKDVSGWVVRFWVHPCVLHDTGASPERHRRDLADRRFAEDLDLDALAAAAAVSKYHFNRCFAATYGETPVRYLTRRRIERAQDLLRVGNLTVTEVCMMVGFASLGSFSSRFRQLVGESPTSYRSRWDEAGAPHIPGCFLFMKGVVTAPTEPHSVAQSRRSTETGSAHTVTKSPIYSTEEEP